MAQQQRGRPEQRVRRDEPPRHGGDGDRWARIRFATPLNPELFNSIARAEAQAVSRSDPSRNKPTQLRRFYDELLLWETRVSRLPPSQQPLKFQEYLPFIRMLNAKVAYAEGRKLVDRTFVDLIHHTLNEVTNAESLTICKHFWEAFMGFYKQERQD